MKDKTDSEAANLRRKAEEMLHEKNLNDIELSEFEKQKLIHELEVHQIELELQNEELIKAQAKEKLLANKYQNLYDFAPTAYYTLSKEGDILELNHIGAKMLGRERSCLKNKRFALFVAANSRSAFGNFIENVFNSNSAESVEISLLTKDESKNYVYITGIASENGEQCNLTAIDITERIRAEEDIANSAKQWQATFDSISDAIWLLDEDQYIIRSNKAAEQLYPNQPGKACYEIVHGTSKPIPDCPVLLAKQSHHFESAEIRIGEAWFLVTADPVFDANGQCTSFVHSLKNISERKDSEEAVLRVKNILTEVEKMGNVGGWEFDINTAKLIWSEEVYRIYEVDADFKPNIEDAIKYYTIESRPVIEKALKDAVEFGKPYDLELQIITAKGNIRWVHTIGKTDLEHGRVYGLFQDISERKVREFISLSRSHLMQFSQSHSLNELLEEIINEAEKITNSQIGFLHFVEENQEQLRLQSWSTKTKELFCKAKGEGFHYAVSEAGVWVDCVAQRKALIHNDYASLPHRKGMPEGHATVQRELVYPIFRDDKIKAILGVGNKAVDYVQQDIDTINMLAEMAWGIVEHKRAELALEESEKHLRELNATKDMLFSIIAHDLRSPFNNIVGFSEILIEKMAIKDCDAVVKFAGIINSSSKKAMDLLTNLLEWASLQTGRMVYHPQNIDIELVVNDVLEILSEAAKLKKISITKALPKNSLVCADRNMIKTVLRNLISNAIKFTHPGGQIIISSQQEQNESVFTVRDTGIGIKKETMIKLFRVDESISTKGTNNEKGTGLGLVLCKEFVEKHGGRIWANSEAGKGSSFCFSVPVCN